MHRAEIHDRLSATLRREVDRLIYHVWALESEAKKDVTMLASEAKPAFDTMDALSVHVLVRDDHHKLVGYGRVAIAKGPEDLRDGFAELNISVNEFPFAYVSRLVVHPNFRGQGIASLIHKTRIDIAKQRGAQVIYGWAVGEKPRGALLRCGFREISLRQGFKTSWYETRRDARLVMLHLNTGGHSALAM